MPGYAEWLRADSCQHRDHRFWQADLGVAQAVKPFVSGIHGHKQISDAYLLGLAVHRKGKLVTLDRGVLALLPERGLERRSVVVIE